MLIGSKIKPRADRAQQRNVDLFGTRYTFKNLAGDGHFVAEVTNQQHIETFLANPGFYAYDNAVPALRRSPAPTAPESNGPATPAPAAPDAPNPAPESNGPATPAAGLGDYAPEVIAEANELTALTIAKLGPALGKVSSPVVVKAALLVEQAKGEDARSTVVKMLTDCIEAMKAANVTA